MTAMTEVEVLRAACCIAGADGKVDDAELKMLQQLAEKAGVGRASLEAMISRAETEPEFYKQQFRVLKSEPEETIKLLFGVAARDGQLEKSEIEILKDFARKLGMESETFVQLGRATKAFLDDRA